MRRYHHLVEGVLQPEEIDRLQEIFDKITAAPWFDSSECSREMLATELIKLYRGGVTDPDKLHDLARLTAAAHFSHGCPEEKRKALQFLHDAQRSLSNNRKPEGPNPKQGPA